MKRFVIIIICYQILFVSTLFGQSIQQKKADKYYNNFLYVKALKFYKSATEKDPENPYLTKHLADCYRFVGDVEQAEFWYKKTYDLELQKNSYLLNYAQILKSNGKYAEAETLYKKYNEMIAASKVDQSEENQEFAKSLMKDSAQYQIRNLSINSSQADFGVAFLDDDFIFVSSRTDEAIIKHSWNQQPYLNLYLSSKADSNELKDPVLIERQIRTRFHEGPVTYDPVKGILYFTRNNNQSGKAIKGKDGINNLKIFMSKKEGEKWIEIGELPFNSNDYSVGHPSILSDGKKLYFASDMPGGFGGTDIYVSHWEGDKWGTPLNLGPTINTAGIEMFPFIHQSGILYFSSDGHKGLGGLDIFYARSIGDGFSGPTNMGYPVNSNRDDFSMILDAAGKFGYFSSNRQGGKGDDDIYFFAYTKPPSIHIYGIVKDEKNGNPIKGAKVILENSESENLKEYVTNEDGRFTFEANEQSDYIIYASKEKYSEGIVVLPVEIAKEFNEEIVILVRDVQNVLEGTVLNKSINAPEEGVTVRLLNDETKEELVTTTKPDGKYQFNLMPNSNYQLSLEKQKYFSKTIDISTKDGKSGLIQNDIALEEIKEGKKLILENIYYDVNKWDIRSDASKELNNLIQTLKANPSLKIEINSHTDSRGDEKINLTLSEKRAQSAVKYITSKGIDQSRVISKGYGETKLINQCKDNVPCSSEEHQKNRRTELRVVEF